MKQLSIAYFGTPYFSAHLLEKMLADSELKRLIKIKFVVTRPDKPVGRRQTLTPSPVKPTAKKYGIEVFEFDNLRIGNSLKIENLKLKIKKLDFCFLYAYGAIIPNNFLSLPKLGFLNTHPSLLPKYRGPSPIAYPLILGDKETGVTLIQLDEKIDHGPILAQEKIEISPYDRRPDLEIKLTDLAFEIFKKFIKKLANSSRTAVSKLYTPTPQNEKESTYTRMLNKKDGFLPFHLFQKALKNKTFEFNELSEIVKEYVQKYEIQQKTRLSNAGFLHLAVPQDAETDLSSHSYNTRALINCQEENSKRRGGKGNRTPGTRLDRPSPHQATPTQNPAYQKYNSSLAIYDLFRGLYPWPGLWTYITPTRCNWEHPKRLKITDLQYKYGSLTIQRVQLEGKKEVDFKTFNTAYNVFTP